MGAVDFFPLQKLVEQYGLRVFFATGTGTGDGLRVATQFPFDRIISVEVVEELAAGAARRFAHDPRVEVHHGRSSAVMRRVLGGLAAPVLFWLDAHFPGADFGLRPRTAEPDLTVRTPLARELAVIRDHRDEKDVVCIDDLWLYKEGVYGAGVLPDRAELVGTQTADFIFETLGPTHRIEEYPDSQGYLMALPKPGMLWRAPNLTTTDLGALESAMRDAIDRFGSPLRVLEIGTGQGETVRDLKRFAGLYGVDLAYAGIDSQRDHPVSIPYPGATLTLGDSATVHRSVSDDVHVVFVDGCHCLAHVLADLRNYGPKVVPAGLLVFLSTHPAIQGIRDYQGHGPRGDPLFNISVRTALETLGAYDRRQSGWDLFADSWDVSTAVGGVTVLRRTPA